jgi:hypothetical protein
MLSQFDIALRPLGIAERDVRAIYHPILFARSGGDHDRGLIEQVFVGHIDSVAPCLAQAAADAFVGEDDWSQKSCVLDRIAGGIDLGADAGEFNRVVTGMHALIDAELAGLTPGVWQAGLRVNLGQADSADLLFFERQRANGSGRTDLTAGVAA